VLIIKRKTAQGSFNIAIAKIVQFRDHKTIVKIGRERDGFIIRTGDFIRTLEKGKLDSKKSSLNADPGNKKIATEPEVNKIHSPDNPMVNGYVEYSISDIGFLVGFNILLNRISLGGFLPYGWDNFKNPSIPPNTTYISAYLSQLEYLDTVERGGTTGWGFKIGFKISRSVLLNYIFGRFERPVMIDRYYLPLTGVIWWSYHEDPTKTMKNENAYYGADMVLLLKDNLAIKAGWISTFDSSIWVGLNYGFTLGQM
jgi:hypothetical protein